MMRENRKWEYRVEKIGGVFKLRARNFSELQELCSRLGQDGWELAAVTYDWLVVTYMLFFRRICVENRSGLSD